MNRCNLMLSICLALTAAQSFAREPQAPPSPSGDGGVPQVGTIKEVPNPNGYGATSFYVGHYGEAIEIPYYWIAEAELRGTTEAVYFHRKFSDDNSLHPFQPKAADYKPENFARLELMELVVIPKNAPGGLRSLKAIRLAKEKEIAAKGPDSKISAEQYEYKWPRGTFQVRTSQPYRMVQTYGESPKEFYILTTGGNLATGDYGLSEKRSYEYNYAAERALESLAKHLFAVHKETLDDFVFKHAPDTSNFFSFVPAPNTSKDLLASFTAIRFLGLYGTLGAGMLILAFWPGASPWGRRVRLFGRSLFLFAHLSALIGFLLMYIPIISIGVKWGCSDDATLIPVLLIPWISGLAAMRLGSARTKRVLISTGVLAALWTILILLVRRSGDSADYDVFVHTAMFHLIGMIFGIVFALAFGPLPQKEDPR